MSCCLEPETCSVLTGRNKNNSYLVDVEREVSSPKVARLSSISLIYVCIKIGTIYDCYIVEFDRSNNEMKLHEFVYGNDKRSDRDSNDLQH